MLKDLIKNISSWPELETRIAGLPTEHDRGYAFEEFCHAFFILDPVFQFKKVYRQNKIPASILKRIGYPGRKDIGIDGVAISNDNKITTYQAKFRRDRKNTPTLRELSTYFTMSDRADWRITITNANKLPSSIHDRTRQSCILSDRFCQLKPDFFKRLRIWLSKKTITPAKKITPHKTQKEAINAAVKHFKDNSRGQMILPCGTGKTLAAMWIVEKLGGRRILVMLPSLALMSQTLREWAENTSLIPFRYLCLCSDTTVDLGNDSPVEHIHEMDIPVTTDSDVVAEYLRKNTKTTSILFSTYQSSKVLSEATLKSKTKFDTAIFDEAHRTAGTQASIWSLALDDKNVPVKRRLFMTATPRIYAPHITKKAKDEDVLLCSMDDHTVYGETIYKMSFGQAIERDLITDYKVVVICITDAEVRELVKEGGRVITIDNQEWDAKALAKRLALAKALDAYGFKKIFTFHGKVSGAKAFTDTGSPYSIKQVIEMVGAKKHKQDEIKFFHVNGTMSSGNRKAYLDEFKEALIGIMSNARCLTEGVDVPAVDAIAFIDPKKSLIDIVQATGRAMRKAKGKGKGYIFVPVVVGEDEGPEECLGCSDFKTVWQILQAMVEQDRRLQDNVSRLRVLQGKGDVDTKEWKAAMAEYSEKFEFFNLPGKIDVARFTETLYTKAIEVIAKSWDFWYGLTLKYKQEFGNTNVPQSYKTPDGFNLGNWQSNQRKNFCNGKLDNDRIKRLEKIGFIWDVLEEVWEKGYQETLKYKEQFKNANAPIRYKTPRGFKLGTWQSNQRANYRNGRLGDERVNRLEKIGFIWNIFEEAWKTGYQATLKYKRKFGDANVYQSYKTPEGFKLGSWQSEQRKDYKKGKLDNNSIKKLEDIGFIWDLLDEAGERGYQETLKYKHEFGNSNAPNKYETRNGYRLGQWQSVKKKAYNKGELDKERIKQLEDIGFIWDVLDEAWEKGYQETLKYKHHFGDTNVPRRHKTPTGFNLGAWVGNQKTNYDKDKLDKDKIKRLENIGFVWDLLDEAWEKGYKETCKYKQQFGVANAPNKYMTSKGFKLGWWQGHQRTNCQKEDLDNERIKRLEEIGFVWDQLDEAWEKGYQETLTYKQQFGNANAPQNYKTTVGFSLGIWQNHQKANYDKGKLGNDRIKRLDGIGFIWGVFEEAWERGYQETLKYKQQFGNANAPQNYKTTDGFSLGSWQSSKKTNYDKGKLGEERIKRLEDIGFVWNQLDEAWERGYQETIKYKQQFGNANAPAKYKTPGGFKLGSWQSSRRNDYAKKKLDNDRIKRLEEVGFIWNQLEEAWEKGYQEILKYKQQFGVTNVPGKYKTLDGFKLGSWQSEQKKSYTKGKLDKDKIKRLEDIGFIWKVLGEAWGKGYQETLKYKQDFGKASAPREYKTLDGFKPGTWQHHQRRNYKDGKLDKEKIEKLEDIGFVWDVFEEIFEKGYQETITYKQQSGKTNAPLRYKTSDGFKLGSWQSHRRRNYGKGELDKVRIKRLEDLGFVWDGLDEAWEKGCQETFKYKQQFGKPNAPHSYKTPDGFNLRSWQTNQTTNYNNGKLDKERIKRLEDIGFVWDRLKDAWEKGYQETVKYKQQFGKPNALHRYKTSDGFKLGGWQATQKEAYNNGKLDNDRIKRLEDLEFVWDVSEDAWDFWYGLTLKYKEQFGAANTPNSYKTPDGFKLGSWQGDQKKSYTKSKLDKDKIKRLEDIGFIWDLLDEAWEKGYSETLKYKQQFGNANSKHNYKTPDGFNIGSWQNHQMRNYRKGELDKDRIKKLEDIGFVWDKFEEMWKRGYQETLKYKQQFRNANAPAIYKSPDGFTLGRWHVAQRANYAKGKLDKARITRLEKIGFVWVVRKP